MDIPDYKTASNNRVRGDYSRLEYFITEWEPPAVVSDQQEIERWRNDLLQVVIEQADRNEKISLLIIRDLHDEVNFALLFLRCVVVLSGLLNGVLLYRLFFQG